MASRRPDELLLGSIRKFASAREALRQLGVGIGHVRSMTSILLDIDDSTTKERCLEISRDFAGHNPEGVPTRELRRAVIELFARLPAFIMWGNDKLAIDSTRRKIEELQELQGFVCLRELRYLGDPDEWRDRRHLTSSAWAEYLAVNGGEVALAQLPERILPRGEAMYFARSLHPYALERRLEMERSISPAGSALAFELKGRKLLLDIETNNALVGFGNAFPPLNVSEITGSTRHPLHYAFRQAIALVELGPQFVKDLLSRAGYPHGIQKPATKPETGGGLEMVAWCLLDTVARRQAQLSDIDFALNSTQPMPAVRPGGSVIELTADLPRSAIPN